MSRESVPIPEYHYTFGNLNKKEKKRYIIYYLIFVFGAIINVLSVTSNYRDNNLLISEIGFVIGMTLVFIFIIMIFKLRSSINRRLYFDDEQRKKHLIQIPSIHHPSSFQFCSSCGIVFNFQTPGRYCPYCKRQLHIPNGKDSFIQCE